MATLTSQKYVRNFIDVINYYHYMGPRRSHNLAPLTRLTSNKQRFKWTQFKKDAFEKLS